MKKRIQCKACPWRKDVVPGRDIPGGYCVKKHEGLRDTIATKDPAAQFGDIVRGAPLKLMACHESPGEGSTRRSFVCVGWLANQLGPGNNIMLRLRASAGDFPPFELVGEQHATLEDTIPKKPARRRR